MDKLCSQGWSQVAGQTRGWAEEEGCSSSHVSTVLLSLAVHVTVYLHSWAALLLIMVLEQPEVALPFPLSETASFLKPTPGFTSVS